MTYQQYCLYTDAGARGNPGKAAAAAVLTDGEGRLIDINAVYLGITTNNIAEYEGLLLGLQLAQVRKCLSLLCYMDSQLVVKQIRGEYKVKDENLKKQYEKTKKLLQAFTEFHIEHVMREKNSTADKLVNIILDNVK